MLTLGIDLGTTKAAGVLLSSPDNTIQEVVSVDSGAALDSPHEWERIQEPETILEKALFITEKLKIAAKADIAGIGISSQMHGILYVDGQGKPLSPLYTWQDNRAARPGADGTPSAIGLIREKTGSSSAMILKHSGDATIFSRRASLFITRREKIGTAFPFSSPWETTRPAFWEL